MWSTVVNPRGTWWCQEEGMKGTSGVLATFGFSTLHAGYRGLFDS